MKGSVEIKSVVKITLAVSSLRNIILSRVCLCVYPRITTQTRKRMTRLLDILCYLVLFFFFSISFISQKVQKDYRENDALFVSGVDTDRQTDRRTDRIRSSW